MTGGALAGGHRRMDPFLLERLRHLRMACQAQLLACEVGFLRIGPCYLMTTAAAGLSKGRVSNALDQSFIVRAMGIVTFVARDPLHRKRRVGAFNLRSTEVVAGKTNFAGRALQQRLLP